AVLRWLAPSAAAASGGAALAGVLEGAGMRGAFGSAAAAGFVALVAFPVLFAASMIARGLWHAWQPRALGLIEEGGSAPRLAGWLAYVWLAALALAWVMFQGTWLLAGATAFKPQGMAFAEPVLAVTCALVLVAISRPTARALTWLYRKLDRRIRVTPLRLLASLVIKTVIIAYLVWIWFAKRRIGSLDFSALHVPLVAVLTTALVHLVWERVAQSPRSRAIVGGVLGALAAVLIACALVALQARPALTLAIWGERPIAGLAIDKLFDLDEIRAGVSLSEFRPVEKPGAAHPDIILITIDTVRADHTPPYGGSAEMPLLRELGVRGAVFEWAFAPSNVTRRSIPSMVTGLAPNRVRGRVVGWALRIDPRHVLVAERMQAGGYDTAGFVCCAGFWGADFKTGLQRGLKHLVIEPNGTKLAKQARVWLDQREKQPNRKPLFVWMHLLEPHNWQAGSGPPANDDERRRFYNRSLTAVDTMMVEMLGAFSQRKPEDAPIVIVTADHGEALGEHGQPFHSTDLYNSQIRVPFVIAGPGIKPGKIPETVSLTDLTPTMLELAGFVPPSGQNMDGRSVADLAQGRRAATENGIAFAAMIKDRSNPGGVTAVVRGRWKIIDTGQSLELYDVHTDPNELSNIATAKPQVYNDLRGLLLQYLKVGAQSPFE
ncbi:MAG TPA: sulfatase, partial [Kofleriaceae bacterium]